MTNEINTRDEGPMLSARISPAISGAIDKFQEEFNAFWMTEYGTNCSRTDVIRVLLIAGLKAKGIPFGDPDKTQP